MRRLIASLAIILSLCVPASAQFNSCAPGFCNPQASGFFLDFTPGVLPAGVTETRSTVASYYNSSGILNSAAINAARFTYDPTTLAGPTLWVEPAATNLILPSIPAAGTAWSVFQSIPTYNATTSPDGTTNAASFASTTNTQSSVLYNDTGAGNTLSGNTVATDSVFIKSGTQTTGKVIFGNVANVNGAQAVVDTNAGTITSSGSVGTGTFVSATIQAFPNGWYRICLTGTLNGLAPAIPYQPSVTGLATVIGLTYQQYGLQVELGPTCTSTIFSTTAQLTRAADAVQFATPSFPNLKFTFADNSTQTVTTASMCTAGTCTIPTNLTSPFIKTIAGTP